MHTRPHSRTSHLTLRSLCELQSSQVFAPVRPRLARYVTSAVTSLGLIPFGLIFLSFGLKIFSQVTTKLSQLHSNSRNEKVNSRKYQLWAYAVYARSP